MASDKGAPMSTKRGDPDVERMQAEHRAYALRMRAAAPAYPGSTAPGCESGMTIREAFAMAAMQGLMPGGMSGKVTFDVSEIAKAAVNAADALLAALAEEPKP